jgi:hypothetical protein
VKLLSMARISTYFRSSSLIISMASNAARSGNE